MAKEAAECSVDELGVPLLGEIELRAAIGDGGDRGEPAALGDDESGVFHQLALRILTDVAPLPGAKGCSARLLDALDQSVQAYSS